MEDTVLASSTYWYIPFNLEQKEDRETPVTLTMRTKNRKHLNAIKVRAWRSHLRYVTSTTL